MPLPSLGPPGALEVVLFGPGFGESIVVRTADDEWLVIDSLRHQGTNPALALMKQHNAVPLLALLTHPHLDHCEGFSDLLRMRGARTIAACAAPFERISPRGRVASKRARASRHEEALTAIATHEPAQKWAPVLNSPFPRVLKRTAVVALYPPARFPKASSSNRHATPLRVVFGATTVLLGADLSRAGWTDLSKRGVAVAHQGLKVPHHGSDFDHHDSWLLGDPGRCWMVTPWRLGREKLPRLDPERDLPKLLKRAARIHVSFLGTSATGKLTLAAARTATRVKAAKLPKGLRVEAILDSGRVDESWIWASFDDKGSLVGIKHGKDAAVITP